MLKKVIIVLMLSIMAGVSYAQIAVYKNSSFSAEERANDLLQRLTLEEKVSLMLHQSAAIPRLGIPQYNWWNECLHGVARAGIATVFPQAIGLAAMFNPDLMYNIADVISTEARAKHHDFVRGGNRGMYQGLTFWTPNINIVRDPRWGRSMETYGECPYLTSRKGVAFVRGLQGNNPKYLKTIATAKHFAVHSGPEPLRHSFNAVVDDTDLYNTYLPAFEALVKEGQVYSVMCAYNRFNDEPCCGSDRLLNRILREDWGFEGYVVSDCWAIDNFFGGHQYLPTVEESVAEAVAKGTDLECGGTYRRLVQSVSEGLISEEQLDVSLGRLLTAQIKLGMFDSECDNPYGNIPLSVVASEPHRHLALEAARQSVVLLKNEGNTLPLSKDLKRILICGPNADDEVILWGNYNGQPVSTITPLQGIRNKLGKNAKVLYEKGVDHVNPINFDHFPLSTVSWESKPGFFVEYFQNDSLHGTPVLSRMEEKISLFLDGGEIAPDVLNRYVSFRARSKFVAPENGAYEFEIVGDEGARLFLDDRMLIDSWEESPKIAQTSMVDLKKGQVVDIRFEYFQHEWYGETHLKVSIPGESSIDRALKVANKSDVIVMFGGISPRLEGEELRVKVDGFYGGDRTTINLPEVQKAFLKELYATGKPVILVLINGSAIALNWEDDNIPAILETWYGGEAGGTAIADVLFGDYNPAGRLPLTFYSSDDELVDFLDYDMKNRTYRYYSGKPLYSFGHGLSYSDFQYSAVSVDFIDSETIHVTLNVKNTSKYGGDEVVQVYLEGSGSLKGEPKLQLVGFERKFVAANESETIVIPIKKENLRVYDDKLNDYTVVSGKRKLLIGASSTDVRETVVLDIK